MPNIIKNIIIQYTEELKSVYGEHFKAVILYGSYARGDYNRDSDVDIMILLDLSEMEIKKYRKELSNLTYDYNYDNNLEIMPIAKNQEHFRKWVKEYPFYSNVAKEGVTIYGTA